MNEIPNSSADCGLAVAQNVIQPKNVTLKKKAKILWSRRNIMIPKKFANQTGISSATEFHSFEAVHRVEFRFEYLGKRLHARASSADQRPIDIEQNQPNHLAKLNSRSGTGNDIEIKKFKPHAKFAKAANEREEIVIQA